MKLNRMMLMAAVLMGTAALLFLPGCNVPGAAEQHLVTEQPSLPQVPQLQPIQMSFDENTDTNDPWYWFLWWNEKGNKPTFTSLSGGQYSLTWNSGGAAGYNFTCGKGLRTGVADVTIHYSGTFNPGNNGYLALYGWTEKRPNGADEPIEYYVLDSWGNWDPKTDSNLRNMNTTVDSDGGRYSLYSSRRTGQPWIREDDPNNPNDGNGKGNFDQFWSIRQTKKPTGSISGDITFKNHIAGWQRAGMILGPFVYYQVMETEGWESTGNSNITADFKVAIQPIPHPAPTNLKLAAQRHGIYRDLVLNWTSSNSNQVKSYYIYLNGSQIASVPKSVYAWGSHRVYPDQHDTHRFYVRALFIDGALSEPSNTVSYKR